MQRGLRLPEDPHVRERIVAGLELDQIFVTVQGAVVGGVHPVDGCTLALDDTAYR